MRVYRSSTQVLLLVMLLGAGSSFISVERAIGQVAQPVVTAQPEQSLTQAKSHFRRAEFKQAIAIYSKILTNSASEASAKIGALVGWAEIDLWISSTQSAEDKLQQALKLSRENDRILEAEILALLGWAARNRKEFPKAIELLNQSLTLAQQTKNSNAEARSKMILGSVFYVQEQYPKALEALKIALKIAESNNHQDEVVDIYDWMGTTHRDAKDFKQAEENFQKQQPLSRSIGYRIGEISGLMAIASAMDLQKKPELAIKTYQQALGLAKSAANPWLVKSIAIEQAWLYVSQKKTEKAVQLYRQTLPFAQAIDSAAVADIQNRIGIAYGRNEQYSQALVAYQQALTLAEKTNNSATIAQILSNIGYTYKKQNFYPKSREVYQKALLLYETLNNQSEKFDVLNAIGHSYLSESNAIKNKQKDYPRAKLYGQQGREFFQKQLLLAQKQSDRIQAFYASLGIGQSYDSEAEAVGDAGKYLESLDFAKKGLVEKQKALAIAESLADTEKVLSAQYGIWSSYYGFINMYDHLEQYDVALEFLEKARKLALILKKPELEPLLLRSEQMVYLNLVNLNDNPLQNAKRLIFLQKVIDISNQLKDPGTEALYSNLMAIVYYSQGQYDRALEIYGQALVLARSAKTSQSEIFSLHGMGLIAFNRSNYPKALELYRQALAISSMNKRKNLEATAFNNIANVYQLQGEYGESLKHYKQAGEIDQYRYETYRKGVTPESIRLLCSESNNFSITSPVGQTKKNTLSAVCDEPVQLPSGHTLNLVKGNISSAEKESRSGIANNLNNRALVYFNQGDYPKALELHQQSLIIHRELKDERKATLSLHNIAVVYLRQGNYYNSLSLINQALKTSIDQKNPSDEITYRTSLAYAYSGLGQYSESLGQYQKAFKLSEQLSQPLDKARITYLTANVYAYQGKYAKALSSLQEALAIQKDLGVPVSVINTLAAIGDLYQQLGDFDQAIAAYQQSLQLAQKIGARPLETQSLNGIASVYREQNKLDRSQSTFEQALKITKEIGDRDTESIILQNLGQLALQKSQPSQTLSLLQLALSIQEEIGTRRNAAKTLSLIGKTQAQLNQSEAQASLQSAIALSQELGDTPTQAQSLANLGQLFKNQNQSQLAIVFYKQSISLYESIRLSNRTLPKDQQETYTKTVETSYRDLADLLLKDDRILEAQQVLDLLKVQELNTYLKNVRGTTQPLETLPPETEILKKYSAIQTNAIALGQELSTLRKMLEPSRSIQQNQRISQLDQLQRELNQQFNEFTDRPDIKALIQSLARRNIDAYDQSIKTADLNKLRTSLKQLNAVMIYPLILDDRLELIITTPDSPPLRRTVNVKREDLNKAILDFRIALESNDDRVNSYAQKLYTWLIKPLEADLKSSNPTTLIYAPDGQLRYIPIAALHDGMQWLIERYAINHITAKSLMSLTQNPHSQPKILAGAIGGKVSESSQVRVGTRSFDFVGLPGTNVEVDRIQALQPSTQLLKETQFTLLKLLPKFADYNILHLATHAAIVPGNPEDSFILFGGQTTATLKDIENWDLSSFDLVILSACQTGLAGNFGTHGEEVLGLGYQFQNRGAKATIASLWKVDDNSTQQLMTEFYGALKSGKTKNQALQTAQIALISGTATKIKESRSSIKVESIEKGSSNKERAIDAAYRHPYYWAPFILIGNGL